MEVRNCLVCGTEFLVTRVDRKCCTQVCSSSLASRRNYIKKKEAKLVQPRKEGEPGFRECNFCNEVKPIEEFYYYRESRHKQCKSCVYQKSRARYVKKTRERSAVDETLYSDLYDYLQYMKRKRFMANEVDIFRLIDMYDRVFPMALIPSDDDSEEVFNKMFYKLAKHYQVEVSDNNI